MMIFGRRIDENTHASADGYLTFDSGKKVLLTEAECKEVEARLIMARTEGKVVAEVEQHGLKFTCPNCGSHRLECCEDGPYSSEVLNIDEEGDFDYGEIDASGMVDRFQCLNCGYVLINDEGFGEYPITDTDEVVEWIKKHG